jgi:hypothetical protein
MSFPQGVTFGSPEGAPCNNEVPAVAVSSKRQADAQKAGTAYAYGRIHEVALRWTSQFRSRSAGLGSLENELCAGSGRKETTRESEMQGGDELAFSEFVRLMGAAGKKADRWL